MRGLRRFAVAALLIAACARIAAPPGGPPRSTPPRLLGVFPDSGVAPCDFRGVAEFRFDEVTSEGATPNFGTGQGDLEKLIVFSPDTAVPVVEWHRDRITVRPRTGWRPNRTYRIELLPGVMDLRQNFMKTGQTISFTTCGPPPTRMLSGRAADWMTARPLPGALIEAFHLPDSARYRTVADSTGRFRLTELPDGAYLVIATADNDRNRRRDPQKEPWDSVRVAASRDTVGEIWTFPRDTLPPRIMDATRLDSQAILVTFAKPLDPLLRLDSASVHVRVIIGRDTVSIGPEYAVPKVIYDSLNKPPAPAAPPPRDSAAAARDSAAQDSMRLARPQAPANARPVVAVDTLMQKRPPLGTALVIRTRGLVQLGQRYVIDISGVRTAGGQTGPPVFKLLATPSPPSAADSAKAAKAKVDSIAKFKADSLKADSLKRARAAGGGGGGGGGGGPR